MPVGHGTPVRGALQRQRPPAMSATVLRSCVKSPVAAEAMARAVGCLKCPHYCPFVSSVSQRKAFIYNDDINPTDGYLDLGLSSCGT